MLFVVIKHVKPALDIAKREHYRFDMFFALQEHAVIFFKF